MNYFETQVQSAHDADERNMLDQLIVVVRHKSLILTTTTIFTIAGLAFSLTLPNIYRSATKLMPPQQAQSGAAALLSQLGGVAGAAASVAGLKNPNDLYIGMLRSRTVADRLIDGYDLKKIYKTDSQENARKMLEANTAVISGKDGLITIEVEDESKERALLLANGYVEQLVRLTQVLAVTEAKQRRIFFERQLEASKDNLAKAEIDLSENLDSGGVVSVDGDTKAIVEMIARVRAQISAHEIQLTSLKAFITVNNPEYKRINEELIGLRAELSKLQNGRPSFQSDVKNSKKSSGLSNIKTMRDIKYYQMLYELLAKQYEIARLDEAKDGGTIQVLDAAVLPERKAKPSRAVIVVMAAIFGFFSSLSFAFLLDGYQRMVLNPSQAARMKRVRELSSFKATGR